MLLAGAILAPAQRTVAAVLKAEGRLIGHLPFHPWFATRIWEIGWVFDPQHHGHGYAAEAAVALLRTGARRWGCTASSPPASRRTSPPGG